MRLQGVQVLLREFTDDDADPMHAIHADPKLLRYYPPDVGTAGHTRNLVDTFIRWAAETPRKNYQLAIVDRYTDELLGSCGVRTAGRPAGDAEFGIAIASSSWRQGVAHDAAATILQFAFVELRLEQISGVAVAQNEAVGRFVQRLGFTPLQTRRGPDWMTERGWSATEWVLTREQWKERAG